MHSFTAFSLLALAGSVVALPTWGDWSGFGNYNQDNNQQQDNNQVATEVAVVTAYTTITMDGNWPAPTPASATPVVATSSPAFQTWAPASATPAPQATAASASTGTYMDIVEKWRGKLGMSDLTHDATLEGNALKTCNDGNGQMVHELNPGSFAQVLAPGDADEFEKVFVGGWLCERSNLPGLDGICNTMSQGWSYNGETGHADILTSKSYSKIGCALAKGIWGCDLA